MDISRITISLEPHERVALLRLAKKEVRDPRDQARYLIRSALVKYGFIKSTESQNDEVNQCQT